MHVLGSLDAVIASIREEADAEVERIREHGAAPVPGAERRPETAAAPHLNAERKRNDERIAQVEWEEKRRVIEQRETWIARVIARANELLAQTDKATLDRLAAEAKQAIRCVDVTVERAPGGGCIVRSGALVVDNSFSERAKRLEPVWRKALAEMYRV